MECPTIYIYSMGQPCFGTTVPELWVKHFDLRDFSIFLFQIHPAGIVMASRPARSTRIEWGPATQHVISVTKNTPQRTNRTTCTTLKHTVNLAKDNGHFNSSFLIFSSSQLDSPPKKKFFHQEFLPRSFCNTVWTPASVLWDYVIIVPLFWFYRRF